MDLALFDLDNTLLGGDSDLEWGEFLMARGALDRATFEPLRNRLSADYRDGRLDVGAFYACQLEVLTRHPRAVLEAWREEYLEERIRPIIGQPARALVRRHQDEGALCAVVTGTSAFTTSPIARELGIPHLVATVPAWDGQRFTGAVRGTAAYGPGKVVRVVEWLESLGHSWETFGETWFYSDSHNDLPLLVKVSRPVAVDPDPILRRAAEARGWPILDLR